MDISVKLSKKKENVRHVKKRTSINIHSFNDTIKIRDKLKLVHSKLNLLRNKSMHNRSSIMNKLVFDKPGNKFHSSSFDVTKENCSKQNKKTLKNPVLLDNESNFSFSSKIQLNRKLNSKRENFKFSKKIVSNESLIIPNLIDISKDIEDYKDLSKEVDSIKKGLEEFFNEKKINIKKGFFEKKKPVLLIEPNNFLFSRTSESYQLNKEALEVLSSYRKRFKYILYSKLKENDLELFRKLLGKDSDLFKSYLGSSYLYCYKHERIKSCRIVDKRHKTILIDSKLSNYLFNKGNMVYVNKDIFGKNFAKFNYFLKTILKRLVEKNFDVGKALLAEGIDYDALDIKFNDNN